MIKIFLLVPCPQDCGFKGASIFMLHQPFNMAKGFVVDDLHCLYLGVVKQLLTYWFGVQHARYAFSIRSKVYSTTAYSVWLHCIYACSL